MSRPPPRVEVRSNHNNSYTDEDFNRDVQEEMRRMEKEMRNSKVSSQHNDQLRDNNNNNNNDDNNIRRERNERREIKERNERNRLKRPSYQDEIDDRK
jgi:hypothetical protein